MLKARISGCSRWCAGAELTMDRCVGFFLHLFRHSLSNFYTMFRSCFPHAVGSSFAKVKVSLGVWQWLTTSFSILYIPWRRLRDLCGNSVQTLRKKERKWDVYVCIYRLNPRRLVKPNYVIYIFLRERERGLPCASQITLSVKYLKRERLSRFHISFKTQVWPASVTYSDGAAVTTKWSMSSMS